MSRPRLRDDLKLMTGYHSPQVEVEIRLNTNESPDPPPAGWSDALSAELSRVQWNRYPDRQAVELRRALAAHYGVEPTMVFAANGSNEILQCLLLAYGGPGRSAAVFEPTYALHSHISRLTGTGVIEGRRTDDTFELGDDEVDRVLRLRPEIVFLCTPNNPTGIVERRGLVDDLAKRSTAQGALLIIDEAYGQFSPTTAVDLVEESSSVVVTRTFSKTWAMAGARLGYVIAPTWVVDALEAVVLPYHLDTAKQIAGRLALRFTAEMRERVSGLVDQRDLVTAGLARLGVMQWRSGANFVLFRPDRPGTEVWQALLDRGILVRDCGSWPRLDGCLRVTIGSRTENEAFLVALAEILKP